MTPASPYRSHLPPEALGLLGLTPLLAVCTALLSSLVMGLSYLALLLVSAATLSACRAFIAQEQGLIYALLVTSAWTSVLDLALQAWCYPLRAQLDIYPLILALNTTLLCQLQDVALTRTLKESMTRCLGAGLKAVALLAAVGLARELFGNGAILTDIRLIPWLRGLDWAQPIRLLPTGIQLFNTPAGALLTVGLLLAALRCCAARNVARS